MVGSICWYCVHAVPSERAGCSWSRFFIFVEGSEYEEKVLPKGEVLYVMSKCPKFEYDVSLDKCLVTGGYGKERRPSDWYQLKEVSEVLGVWGTKVKQLAAEGHLICVDGRYDPKSVEKVLARFKEEEGYITSAEAGEILGVSRNRAYNIAKEGKIPYIRSLKNSKVLMKREDVYAYRGER